MQPLHRIFPVCPAVDDTESLRTLDVGFGIQLDVQPDKCPSFFSSQAVVCTEVRYIPGVDSAEVGQCLLLEASFDEWLLGVCRCSGRVPPW